MPCPPEMCWNLAFHAGSSVAGREAGGFIDTSAACSEASYLIAYVFYSVVYSSTDLLIG